jgi:subtilase family serine protease
VSVAVTPIDDTVVENSETVTVRVIAGSGYIVGTPSSATVSIVSDDVAPDMVVAALSAPRAAAAGGSIDVTDTTRNQGLGSAPASQTSFHLSKNAILDAADPLLGSRAAAALEPGAATTSQTSLVLPAALDAGTYYLFAKADAPGTIAESNEYNNTRISTVAIGPDLGVTGVSAPGLAAAGASVIVSDTTSNQGLGTAPASSTRFFLSSNVSLEAGDAALQARSVPSLPPGATSTGSTTITIPAGTPTGTYYLFAQADAGGHVAEANENNNTRSVLIRIGPDLTVASLTAPTRAAAGGTINITDTTRNVGAGPAPGSSTTFFLSANFVLDATDIRLGPSRQVPPLAANEMSTGTTAVTLPEVPPGAWMIVAKADEANAVGETQETNNTRFAMVQVGPDLSFLIVTAPYSGVAGGAITVSATARNTGGGAAAASIVRFYLSSNVTLDAADLQLDAVRDVPALSPDATHAGTTSVALPAGTAGGRYLLIVADAGQAVAESNELNNVAARFIQISGG